MKYYCILVKCCGICSFYKIELSMIINVLKYIKVKEINGLVKKG